MILNGSRKEDFKNCTCEKKNNKKNCLRGCNTFISWWIVLKISALVSLMMLNNIISPKFLNFAKRNSFLAICKKLPSGPFVQSCKQERCKKDCFRSCNSYISWQIILKISAKVRLKMLNSIAYKNLLKATVFELFAKNLSSEPFVLFLLTVAIFFMNQKSQHSFCVGYPKEQICKLSLNSV